MGPNETLTEIKDRLITLVLLKQNNKHHKTGLFIFVRNQTTDITGRFT